MDDLVSAACHSRESLRQAQYMRITPAISIALAQLSEIARRLGETRRAELRTEFYNLFNHYNIQPGSVDRNIRSVNFGKVGAGVQGQTIRVIQLGAKFYF